MSGPSEQAMTQPAATPMIYIKVVKAEGIRQHKMQNPTPSMLIRVSVSGDAQPEVLKTKPVPAGVDPIWNQEFMLPVPDPTAAQLECTIWDESDPQPQGYSNFLGEVLLNLARLAPYKGHYIEQLFYIKQGKTIVTDEQASGNLKLGLRLEIPDDFVPPRATSPASSHVSPEKKEAEATGAEVQRQAQENPNQIRREPENERMKQEELRKAAEQRAAEEEAEKKAQEEKAAEEARAAAKAREEKAVVEAKERERAEQELNARRQAAEQEAAAAETQRKMLEQQAAASAIEQQRKAEEEQKRQEEYLRMRAQEEEMAKGAALRTPHSPSAMPVQPRSSSPERISSPVPRNMSPSGERPAPARIVIAVIEAQELSSTIVVCPQAKITLQGPVSLSAAQTRSLKNTNEPFWNEKFVFGVEEVHMDDTYICAEIVSSQDEQNPVPVGAIQPVPVTTLLSGQKMSLPTVNQGNYIYCIDGWFEVFRERNGAQVAAMTPTKYPGKSQLHLRMTFIPSNEPTSQPPVAEAPRTPVPTVEEKSASPAPQSVLPSPIPPRVPVVALAPVPVSPAPVAAAPRVLEHQQAPPRRSVRERTPLPVKGGPADVGIVLSAENADGTLLIDELVPGGPAVEGGQIQLGDALIDVDGYDVVGRPVEDAQGLLCGQPNSPVTMILQRGGKGGDPLVVTLLRAIPGGNARVTAIETARAPMMPLRAAPLAPPVPSVAVSSFPPPPPRELPPVSTAAPGQMEGVLSDEFKNIAFLWGGTQEDPVVKALVDWKDDLLYGGPRTAPVAQVYKEDGGPIWEERYPHMAMSGSFSTAAYGSNAPGLGASYGAYNRPVSGMGGLGGNGTSQSEWNQAVA